MNYVLGDRKTIALLLTPALLVYTVITLIPVCWSLGLTFFRGDVLSGFQFTGITNFKQLFNDPAVGEALVFTVKYAVVVTLCQVLVGYGLALLYHYVLKKSSIFVRTLVFFPVVLPTVAVAILFQKLFQSAPNDGLINEILVGMGLSSVDWLGSGTTAFIVIVIMDVWRSVGFYGILVFSGLLDIPEDIVEQARIDGAGSFRLFRHIILPMSLPIVYASFIFSINGTIKVFDSVLALTAGGPGTTTTPLTLYMYRTAFQYSDYGFGATLALVLTVMSLAVTLVVFKASRRDLTV